MSSHSRARMDSKILMYISAMFAFKTAGRVLNDRTALQDRLKDVPSIVVDGLLSRFTETSRDKNECVLIPLITHAVD